MATRKQAAPPQPPTDWALAIPQGAQLDGEADPDEPEQTPADRIVESLSGVRDDDRAYVKVNRITGGKVAWCMDYEPDQFEAGGLKMIREQWGAGTYQLLVYGSVPGTKRFAIRTRATVEIEMPKVSAAQLAGGPAQAPSDIANLVATIAEGQRAMLEALTKRPDPMESMSAQLSMMKLMREAFGNDAKPATPMSELLIAMQEMRKASRMFEGKSDDDDEGGVLGVLKQTLPVITSMMGQQRQLAPVALPPAIAQAHAPELHDNTPENNDPDGDPEMLKEAAAAIKLHALLRTLFFFDDAVQKAPAPEREKARKDAVAQAAETLYEKLPDDLLEMMELPVWFDMLCEKAPEAKAHEAFIRDVHAALLGIVAEEHGAEAGDTLADVREIDGANDPQPEPAAVATVSPIKPKKRG